ncbi:MAG: threonylcarbamoyl-AMP synthase [Clostridia bacterium]|nr:threonylcarbamoyl-AMP synthase [Clostridia bacterium]
MNTKIFTKNELSEAAAMIRNGGIVAMPTETVYGLAANALDAEAVGKIYAAKGRQSDNPLIVHIANLSDWGKLVKSIPPKAKLLADRFWPGPLTIILKKSEIVPDIVSGGLDTVAVRMPKNKIAFRFIKECGVPLAAPSANLSGAPSPTKFSHVKHDLDGKVDGMIDGGDCMVGVESTVITLADEVPVILRPGRVTAEQIERVIGKVIIHESATRDLKTGETAASPGMKYKHYAPKAELSLLDGSDEAFTAFVNANADAATAVICYNETLPLIQAEHTFCIGEKADSVTHAKRLFDILRMIDDEGLTTAYAPLPDKNGVGLAVLNRMLRASGFRVIALEAQNKTSKTDAPVVKKSATPVPQAKVPAKENISAQAQTTPVENNAAQNSTPSQKSEEDVLFMNTPIIEDFSAFEEDSAILALNDVKLSQDFNEDFSKEISDGITVVEKTSEEDPGKIYYEAVIEEGGATPAAYPVDSIGDDFKFDVYDDDLKPKRKGFFARLFGKDEEEEEEEPEPFLPLPNKQWNSLAPMKQDEKAILAREEERKKLGNEISGKNYEKIPGIHVIGLTGKSGCGKTYIATHMANKRENCLMINADDVYHEMLESDSLILSLVVAFGDSVLDGKKINRKQLAKLAFASEENLDKLNKTVLPAVAERIMNMIREAKEAGMQTVILDAPTLIESGLNQVCNEVIFIIADPAIRQERIVERDNITLDEIGQRMRFEKDDAFYVRFADRIIRNN